MKEENSSSMKNSEGCRKVIEESQDDGKDQLTKWMWGRKEVYTGRNDLGGPH